MPWYKAGTATVTKGSPDVVGVGTTWGNGAITPGDSFSLVDSAGAAIAPFYEVLSVTDDTHITLNNAAPVSMVVWARFTPAAESGGSPPYYEVAVWWSDTGSDPSPGISLTNYNRAWLAYTAGSYTLPATTVLASGTLNYIAISE